MEPKVVTRFSESAFARALEDQARPFRLVQEVGRALRSLIDAGLADLPLPAGGQTLERWRALAAVGALDLSLAKLYEGHTDALAILAELDGKKLEGVWAVWAAEPPSARVTYRDGTLSGRKQWCSGATVIDHAVLSAWTETGKPMLAQISLPQPSVTMETEGWQAIGMSASASVSVVFDRASAQAVGDPGDYVARPGFWQGGAGIAAVWYGGAVAVARMLSTAQRLRDDPHATAHLGAMDTALRAAKALLTETAAWIDANPRADAAAAALRVRAFVEAAAHEVLLRSGRALGPSPLCGDAVHAQRCADLPVFLRQSHAEHDLSALGRAVLSDCSAWEL